MNFVPVRYRPMLTPNLHKWQWQVVSTVSVVGHGVDVDAHGESGDALNVAETRAGMVFFPITTWEERVPLLNLRV
jgi:hypothetical protein